MGCCCSCPESSSQSSNRSEKTRLLNTLPGQSTSPHTVDYGARRDPPNGNLDEQEKLNRIVQKTTDNYIDIPAMDSPTEQPDYRDKEEQYQKCVKGLKPIKSEEKALLKDIPHPEKELSADPVPVTDLKLAEDASEQVHEAVKNVKVAHKEELLVHFSEQ